MEVNRFASPLLRLIDRVSPPETASAHCDIPCGIYDPHAAQIAALTVVRMNQLIGQLQEPSDGKQQMDSYANSMSRYVVVKENHAEVCKRELDILWHDYFKPEHLQQHPDLHTKFWNATKLASKNKQTVDAGAAGDLLNAVNDIAEIFWSTKGVQTKRAPTNQTAGGEFVLPS